MGSWQQGHSDLQLGLETSKENQYVEWFEFCTRRQRVRCVLFLCRGPEFWLHLIHQFRGPPAERETQWKGVVSFQVRTSSTHNEGWQMGKFLIHQKKLLGDRGTIQSNLMTENKMNLTMISTEIQGHLWSICSSSWISDQLFRAKMMITMINASFMQHQIVGS